jgi:hypothetical protein
VSAHRVEHPAATMCRVLGVSPSGFYAWRHRPLDAPAVADVHLSAQIAAAHGASQGTYGVPRIHAELAAQGVHIGRQDQKDEPTRCVRVVSEPRGTIRSHRAQTETEMLARA